MATSGSSLAFAVSLTIWGFAFWMAIPSAFLVLAERSANPGDRAGDAQAIMAGGRVIGPLVGGVVLDGAGSTALGVVGGGMMLAAAGAVLLVRLVAAPRDREQFAIARDAVVNDL